MGVGQHWKGADTFWHKSEHTFLSKTTHYYVLGLMLKLSMCSYLILLPRKVSHRPSLVEVLPGYGSQSRLPWEKSSWPGLNGDVSFPQLYNFPSILQGHLLPPPRKDPFLPPSPVRPREAHSDLVIQVTQGPRGLTQGDGEKAWGCGVQGEL